MAADIPYFTLNNGVKIPSVGIGCWMGAPGGGEKAEAMCKNALKLGYRHIDTAYGYGNEDHVGKAIRESGIPREEFFVVTKLPNHHHHRVRESFEESLKALGCDYVDLYLVHWPHAATESNEYIPYGEKPTFIETWKDVEKLLETGKVKSIGVSNFSIKTLNELLPHCTVIPATNQVESHPCLPWFDLKKFCEEKSILLTAYSPLGRPIDGQSLLFSDSDVKAIAEAHAGTVGQVLISWAVKRGTIAIPKSESVERLKANITLLNLSDDDMAKLDHIHKKPGMHRSLLDYHSRASDGKLWGWTYEEIGWPMKEGGIVVEQ